jgi:hypothetical protein
MPARHVVYQICKFIQGKCLKLNIIDLLKMPSMEFSYIVAGLNGVFNEVKRIDILETSYPEVEKYLEPFEFVFTSFWNLKDDKQNRVNLVRAMIRHKCAGIGIMPDTNLKGEIDEEIIDLGNKHSFPVVYIPPHVRWSDIISEFSLLTNSINHSALDSHLVDILMAFSELHAEKNVKKLCIQLNQFLSLPIIISADNTCFEGLENKAAFTVISKIHSIRMQNFHRLNVPISLQISDHYLAIVYYGETSTFATYISSQNITSPKLQTFHKIAPFIVRELDNLFGNAAKTALNKIDLKYDTPYYLVLLRKENINSALEHINAKYFIYEKNEFYNYVIFLIPKESIKENKIYGEYYKIIDNIKPLLFIFSRECSSVKEVFSQIKMLKISVNSLLFLDGIFSIDELPLLYMILYSPYEYKQTVFRVNNTNINLDIEPSFFDTLRLYLVLRNISDVSSLLGMHPNSVKYRISKCLKTDEGETLKALGELPYIKLLLLLEILKVENTFI